MKTTIAAICAVACLGTATSAAANVVLTFDDLAKPGSGFDNLDPASVTYGDFTFTSGYHETPHFLIWRQDDARNADAGGGTFAHRWDSYAMTIARTDGAAFDLVSFDFADLRNEGAQNRNRLTFTYEDGTIEDLFVTSDRLIGLETLALGRKGLKSFSLTADPRAWWQIDNLTIGEQAAVPEPATWAMMILGFGAVGSAMRRRRLPAAA